MQIILRLKGPTLSHHRSPGNLAKSTGYIHPCKSLNCRRKSSDKFVDLVGSVIVASDEDDLVSLGQRGGDLCGDGGQGLEHQRHHGRVPVLLVCRGLHPHTLGLRPTHGLHGPGLRSSDQSDLLPVSLGGLDHLGPVTLGHRLDLVGLRLGGQLDSGDQLLLLPLDLLLLNLDLFPPLYNLDLDLLIPNSLLDLGSLKLVCKLGLSFSRINFLVKVCFLKFECSAVILNLCVSTIFDIHGSFFTLGFSNTRISISLSHSNLSVSLHCGSLRFSKGGEIVDIVVDVLDGEGQDLDAHLAHVGLGDVPDQVGELVPVLVDLLHSQSTQDSSQVTLQSLENCLHYFILLLAQELLSSNTKKFVIFHDLHLSDPSDSKRDPLLGLDVVTHGVEGHHLQRHLLDVRYQPPGPGPAACHHLLALGAKTSS